MRILYIKDTQWCIPLVRIIPISLYGIDETKDTLVEFDIHTNNGYWYGWH